MDSFMMQRYQWSLLQQGFLPLTPTGDMQRGGEHRPTVTLLWPENTTPTRENTLMIDPFFTDSGYPVAEATLQTLGITFGDIGFMFSTHAHYDHVLRLPAGVPRYPYKLFLATSPVFPDLTTVRCPGHADDLQAVVFTDTDDQQVWAVADAILNEDWLRAWQYYWPNQYNKREVIQTWQSVALILSKADVILPGHGAPIPVTPDLIQALMDSFPRADYAADCPTVISTLQSRL